MAALDHCLLFFLNFLLFSWESFGFLDIDEIKNTHYGIELLKTPVLISEDVSPQMVQLATIHGQRYQCNYPDHTVKKEEAEEKEAAQIGIPDLLKPMEDGPCLILTKDWWTYEFCYGKYIQQYHVEDGVPVGKVIYLGFYESEYNWKDGEKEETKQNRERLSRYHSQQYVNGTVCDLTNKPRRMEVRFLCDEGSGDQIIRIDEPESCVYVMTVRTTKICHHPYLKPLSPSKPLSITCNPVLEADQYQDYLEVEAAEKARLDALAEEKAKYLANANAKKAADVKEGDTGGATQQEGTGGTVEEKPEGTENTDILNTFKEAMTNSVKKEFGGLTEGQDGKPLDVKMHFKVVKNTDDLEKFMRELEDQNSETDKEEDDLPAPQTAPPVELMPSDEYIDRSLPVDGKPADFRAQTAKNDEKNKLTTIKSEKERFEALINQKKRGTLDIQHTPDDPDSEYYKEFDNGVQQLIKEGHIREKMVAMKGNVRDAVADKFGDIVDEAQEELQREGYNGPINRKEAFVNLASSLNKLLDILEKSNQELDEVDKRLREAALTAQRKILEQRLKSAELMQKMREKRGEKPGEAESDLSSDTESVLKQLEKKNAELEKHLQEASANKLAAKKFLQEQRMRSTEILRKMRAKQGVEGDPVKAAGVGEKDDVEPHTPEDNRIRVRVTKVKFKDPAETGDKQGDVAENQKKINVLGEAQKQKLENSVREELKKAGLDKSGKKIHIKIITSMPNDGSGIHTLSEEDSSAFNKMIVTILGGNQDEIREAERQQQFEDSYGYVYKPAKKKDPEAAPVVP